MFIFLCNALRPPPPPSPVSRSHLSPLRLDGLRCCFPLVSSTLPFSPVTFTFQLRRLFRSPPRRLLFLALPRLRRRTPHASTSSTRKGSLPPKFRENFFRRAAGPELSPETAARTNFLRLLSLSPSGPGTKLCQLRFYSLALFVPPPSPPSPGQK